MNIAYVPGFNYHLFSLHEDTPKCSAPMFSAGVHLLGGRLTFAQRVSGSYVKDTRVKPNTFIAAAVLSPGNMHNVESNAFRVAVAHSHEVTLRQTARHLGVRVSGELVACAGCFEAKGRRMAVPWTTECRSAKPLQSLFVDLSGKRSLSASGAMYLMVIVADFSRLGCPYLLKMSGVALGFAKILADIRVDGCPSVVESVRSDNGTEFLNTELMSLLNTHGSSREHTSVASPKHDGVVERRIAFPLELAACPLELAMASCLEAQNLFDGEILPPTGPLWAEACHHASDV